MSELPIVIDGDGHVFEDVAGIVRHLPDNYRHEFTEKRLSRLFPPMDHFHEMPMLTRGFGDRASEGPVGVSRTPSCTRRSRCRTGRSETAAGRLPWRARTTTGS
jgi:hypothetical protein